MQIILLADVKKVGRKREIVNVSDGYAQNVLLPKKLALAATPENVKRFRKEEGRTADKKALDRSLLEKNINELDGKTLVIPARANETGTLFKTIHTHDIAEQIEKQFGVVIPETAVQIENIKRKGNYPAVLSFGSIEAQIEVSVN